MTLTRERGPVVVRRYAQPVRVGTAPQVCPGSLAGLDAPPAPGAPIPGGYAAAAPLWFEWAGRRYHVRAVLARWRERRAWWRDVLEVDHADAGTAPAGTAPAGLTPTGTTSAVVAPTAIDVAARERLVWRVEAGPGWLTRTGVFDLACDEARPGEPDPNGWVLLRVSD